MYDKRISQEIDGDGLGEQFKGYKFRITGGFDKQGFPMMQGVLTARRVRLLLSPGQVYFRARKRGERRRKSVRGCIVSRDIAALALVVTKTGDEPVPGLSDKDSERPRRLGPKRANNIRKMFGLTKAEDPREFVVPYKYTNAKGVEKTKKTRVQRLVTPRRVQHKAEQKKVKVDALARSREAAAQYKALMESRAQARRESRRSSRKQSAARQ